MFDGCPGSDGSGEPTNEGIIIGAIVFVGLVSRGVAAGMGMVEEPVTLLFGTSPAGGSCVGIARGSTVVLGVILDTGTNDLGGSKPVKGQ